MEDVRHDHGRKAFWDAKAKTFPRYEAGENTYEAGMLRRIRERGVDFRRRSVLDVGCGSGMYTIRIAQEARQVTAVDISERMLAILGEDAERQGLDNIRSIRSDWDSFDSDQTFDVVFCSMTPAIHDDASRRKLLRLAGGWTVFMGFAGLMSSNVLTGLFAHYGVTPRVFNNGPEMRHWLEAEGVHYDSSLVEGQWVVAKSRGEMLSSCAAMLMPYEVTPDAEHLERYIEAYRDGGGRYVEKTDYRIELLLWEK
ncbi:MAG: class I SAM-dependent methyltransferase [Desulfovibrio sp.]